MNIKKLKDELNIDQKDIAEFFDMTYMAFANSTAKQRYEVALCRFYSHIKKASEEKIKEKNLTDTDETNDPETKPLIIHGVSQRSELLAFEEWVNKNTTRALKDGIKLSLENYKKANCG